MAIMAGRPVNQVERTTVLIFTHLFFQVTIVLVIVIIRRFTSSFFSAESSSIHAFSHERIAISLITHA